MVSFLRFHILISFSFKLNLLLYFRLVFIYIFLFLCMRKYPIYFIQTRVEFYCISKLYIQPQR